MIPDLQPPADRPARHARLGRLSLRRNTLLEWGVALVVATVLVAVWASSVPTGPLLFGQVMGSIMVATSAVVLMIWLVRVIRRRRMSWALVGSIAVLLGGLALAATPLPAAAHWPVVRNDLESALASGECPGRAGLLKVQECTPVAGTTGFDFGTGFLNQVVAVKLDDTARADLEARAAADPTALDGRIRSALGDGWYVVVFEW